MRTVNDIRDKDGFRIENLNGMNVTRRDPIKPEPEGTLVIMAFRVTGYDPDCDGSLMARYEQIHFDNPNKTTGWAPRRLGLSPDTEIVVTKEDLEKLLEEAKKNSL